MQAIRKGEHDELAKAHVVAEACNDGSVYFLL